MTAASKYDEAKHKRDATGKFTFKDGSGNDGRSGSSRGRIAKRRRESGESFGKRAYARKAEKEAEAKAEKDAKERKKTTAEAEREAKRKRREAEEKAERVRREAERRERDLQIAAERRISNPTQSGRSSGSQSNPSRSGGDSAEGVITQAMQRDMTDAARGVKVTGADNVTDAQKKYMAGDEAYRKSHAAALPFKGPDLEEFLKVIKSRYSPVRIKTYDDGTGWFLDDTGVLWKF